MLALIWALQKATEKEQKISERALIGLPRKICTKIIQNMNNPLVATTVKINQLNTTPPPIGNIWDNGGQGRAKPKAHKRVMQGKEEILKDI